MLAFVALSSFAILRSRLEPLLRSPENHLPDPGRTFALLGNYELSDTAEILSDGIAGIALRPVNEHHHVGILLDRASLLEVRQLRLPILAGIRKTAVGGRIAGIGGDGLLEISDRPA